MGRRVLDAEKNELEYRGWLYRDLLRYVYVGNDPVNRRDPLGLATEGAGAQLGGCFAGLCASINPSYVRDDSGNWDVNNASSAGLGLQLWSLELEGTHELTNASSIDQLEGWEWYQDFNGGEAWVGGISIQTGLNESGYWGETAPIGVGASVAPVSWDSGFTWSFNVLQSMKKPFGTSSSACQE